MDEKAAGAEEAKTRRETPAPGRAPRGGRAI